MNLFSILISLIVIFGTLIAVALAYLVFNKNKIGSPMKFFMVGFFLMVLEEVVNLFIKLNLFVSLWDKFLYFEEVWFPIFIMLFIVLGMFQMRPIFERLETLDQVVHRKLKHIERNPPKPASKGFV